MQGMEHSQRSNAVGFNPSFLPDGEGSRQGGGTYTGNATEPTIQDYENFFGPSARDIKTDLQRFKRHGRWHLPDILQGPNPWLTDRIDGLITDATNSPFTTKILPYRYKEEVDGKIKWNVWSFDEGMASRVPYESAARTLTQSKRSFAGYMVRQGMAIVLEHNFMMTPKGRENFKNQLNQLIGSIQYTNDLDVHMALILAPSYQKTMRERYYTQDKSPSQMCREFADLFGMMQKNVNALDILIEEGKAILRTWGGPMPDFLLCNSKLTFQMTMSPEKTNYITQGVDGVKRLRQGPDLTSYRGLSVIHSRSFAMETGQHPRDVLRRRVRTAEYYRILPSKRNVHREFEFYNEERDTWFTLSFQDLLKYARYSSGGATSNAAKVDGIYHTLSTPVDPNHSTKNQQQRPVLGMLGLYADNDFGGNQAELASGYNGVLNNDYQLALAMKNVVNSQPIYPGSNYFWYIRSITHDMGVNYIEPRQNSIWDKYKLEEQKAPHDFITADLTKTVLSVTPLRPKMMEDMYMSLKKVTLYDPFQRGKFAIPGSPEWYRAFSFYQGIIKRGGTPCDIYKMVFTNVVNDTETFRNNMWAMQFADACPPVHEITCQFLGLLGDNGSVNNPLHMYPLANAEDVNGDNVFDDVFDNHWNGNMGLITGRIILLTSDLLSILLSSYQTDAEPKQGIDLILKSLDERKDAATLDSYVRIFQRPATGASKIPLSIDMNKQLLSYAQKELSVYKRIGPKNTGEILARSGISTIPMTQTTMSHFFHPLHTQNAQQSPELNSLMQLSIKSDGHLSIEMLSRIQDNKAELLQESRNNAIFSDDYFFAPGKIPAGLAVDAVNVRSCMRSLFRVVRKRIFDDPAISHPLMHNDADMMGLLGDFNQEKQIVNDFEDYLTVIDPDQNITKLSNEKFNLTIDMNNFFDPEPPQPDHTDPVDRMKEEANAIEDVELVIIRPNIEHNMLGVIMGLGGNELGNTLWGQTELSVYDDSMHGIWGMSYKYHERAIVFNEKNLIRMWDIAYDGYNGGKDDTYVDWTDPNGTARNGYGVFREMTLDLSKNYRGPSMMVMAFVHDKSRHDETEGHLLYNKHFRRNWPSPIVFYDTHNERENARETLPLDYDNVQAVDVEEFRVFNNSLYDAAYKEYKALMPDFRTMHMTRKSAGQSSADAETSTDCLAFQGSMRVKEGGVTQEIQGSGHHGPDYVGVASVRAGKGQKVSGQAPTLHRLI
jgi:hypothetical protein